jgi:hypothetical protein
MVGIGRHVAPTDHALAFFGDHVLQDLFARAPLGGVARQEHLADGEAPPLRNVETESLCFAAKESIGELDQDAGAVAGIGIRATRCAMRQPTQNFETVIDDLAGFRTGDIGDESDAAGAAVPTLVER